MIATITVGTVGPWDRCHDTENSALIGASGVFIDTSASPSVQAETEHQGSNMR